MPSLTNMGCKDTHEKRSFKKSVNRSQPTANLAAHLFHETMDSRGVYSRSKVSATASYVAFPR